MAVEYVKELFPGREGEEDDKNNRRYVRHWEVRTTDPYDDPTIVYSGAGLPAIGDTYDTPNADDDGAVVVKAKATQSDSDPTLWYCSTEYDSASKAPGTGGTVDSAGQGGTSPVEPGAVAADPLARPPVWRGSAVKSKIVVTEANDIDGAPIAVANRAGQPYVPGLEADRSYPTITVTVNKPLSWLNLVTLYGPDGYDDSVNLTTWKGLLPRTVKVESIEWEEAFENGIGFLKVTWTLSVKWDKWDFVVANLGFFELLGDGSADPPTDTAGPWRYRKITDSQGRESTDPVPLDIDGRKLPAGDTPNTTTYRYYRELEFSGVIP